MKTVPSDIAFSTRRARSLARYATPDLKPAGARLSEGAILIVEDEYLIAADLENQIKQDGRKARCAQSLSAANEELKTGGDLAGVILDVNVGGTPSFDLAARLLRVGVPFVFFTGYLGLYIPDSFGTVPTVSKPAGWRDLKGALITAQRQIRSCGIGSFREGIEGALPALRRRAQDLARNPEDADLLVERTLARAISDVADRSLGITIEDWLLSLLERSSSQGGGRLAN